MLVWVMCGTRCRAYVCVHVKRRAHTHRQRAWFFLSPTKFNACYVNHDFDDVFHDYHVFGSSVRADTWGVWCTQFTPFGHRVFWRCWETRVVMTHSLAGIEQTSFLFLTRALCFQRHLQQRENLNAPMIKKKVLIPAPSLYKTLSQKVLSFCEKSRFL